MNLFNPNSCIVYFPHKWEQWQCVDWMSARNFTKFGVNAIQTCFNSGLTPDWMPGLDVCGWKFKMGEWIDKQNNKFGAVPIKTMPPELKSISKQLKLKPLVKSIKLKKLPKKKLSEIDELYEKLKG